MSEILLSESRYRETIYIEFLRILTCFLVIYFLMGDISGVKPEAAFSVDEVSSRIFFLISGCVLLGKKESLKDVWIKRVLRIGIIILVISFIILVFRRDFDVYSWPGKILYNEVNSYLKFLYIYIIAMFFLPLLRKIAQNLFLRVPRGLLCLLILDVVSIIVLYVYNSLYFNMLFNILEAMMYMLLGYWCGRVVDIPWRRDCLDILLSALIGIFTCSYFIVWSNFLGGILSIAGFLLVKMFFQKYPPSEKTSKAIAFGGSLTFGIYLVSGPLQIIAYKVILSVAQLSFLEGTPLIIVSAMILLFIYGIIVVIFKNIPGIGRIVKWFI